MISYESLLRSAQFAKNAYLSQGKLAVMYNAADKLSVFEYTEDFLDIQGFVVTYENDVTIVFRGTESVKDWVHNIRAAQVETPYGNIHKGFWNSWEAIKPTVINCCGGMKDKRIWVVGHSLGAACASVCALDLADEGFNIHRVVTFGSPKVGDDKWKDIYNSKLHDKTDRVVNNNDIVCDIPDTPGSSDKIGYSHVGELHYINSKGMLLVGTSSKDKCFDRVIGAVKGVFVDFVTDHFIDNYIKHIEKYTKS